MRYKPYEFFAAMRGLSDVDLEEWRRARLIGWASLVAQSGNKEMPTPMDFFSLPGDGTEEIDKKIRESIEQQKTLPDSWKQL